jgi:hypothetical protein
MLVLELWLNRVGLSGQKLNSALGDGIGSLPYGFEVGFKGTIFAVLPLVVGRVEVDHEDVEEKLQTVKEGEESREGNGRIVKVNLCAEVMTRSHPRGAESDEACVDI